MLDEKSLVEKYAAMNRRLKRYFDSFFADSPITSIQGLVLDYLFRNRETDVFQKDLEEYLEIKGSSSPASWTISKKTGMSAGKPSTMTADSKNLRLRKRHTRSKKISSKG